jgi:hypothetical protein
MLSNVLCITNGITCRITQARMVMVRSGYENLQTILDHIPVRTDQ